MDTTAQAILGADRLARLDLPIAEAVESGPHRAECREIVAFWKTVRGEDRDVVIAVQRGHQSPGPGPRDVCFSPFWDDLLPHFQRHLVRALS